MKLSVIVPAYNAEKTIQLCLDSILAQNVDDMEVLVVNDGSTDQTEVFLRRYAESRPACFHYWTVENGGQGRARNIGLDHASGDYIGFVDSDDWIEPDMYERMIRKAEEENCDIVICGAIDHFPDGRTEIENFYREGHLMASAGSACNKLFSRTVADALRFPEDIWYEDAEFSARALARSRHSAYLPEPFYHYRRVGQSTMNNSNAQKNLDILTMMGHLEEELLPDAADDFDYLVLNHVLLDAMNRVQAMNAPDKKEVLWLMRAWVHEKIPSLKKCRSFRQESRNRRIIMTLHYLGLSSLAEQILRINARRK